MTVLNVGDRVKVIGSSSLSGKTGTVSGIINDKAFRVKLDTTGSVLMFFSSELELAGPSIGGFKVGDRVSFKYNDYWNDGEAEVIAIKTGAFPIEVKITKQPSKNEFQTVGQTSHWDAVSLRHLPTEKEIDGFKVGDKVGFDNWNDVWKGGEGVVVDLLDRGRGLDPDLKIVVKLTKLPPLNNFYPVGDESAWSSKHLNHLVEIPFKVGDKVTWDYNDHWDDGEGVVTAIDPHDRLPVQVKITKKPSQNVLYDVGYTSNWQVKNLKPLAEKESKFKEGDKVGFSGTDKFLRGLEGTVLEHKPNGYNIKVTKANPSNLFIVKGTTFWIEEDRLFPIEETKPKPVEEPKGLDTHKLNLKPIGTVVQDKDFRLWVHVGGQNYVNKSWEGIESLHSSALVKRYAPIIERVK